MKTTNFIMIDGEKFKTLLESTTGKSLKEISLENGFSNAFLRMVVKTGKASPTAQAVARLYGIEPSAYELKPEPVQAPEEVKQITFDEVIDKLAVVELRGIIREVVTEVIRDNLKAVVIEAVREAFNGAVITKAPSPATAYLRQMEDDDKKLDDKKKFE